MAKEFWKIGAPSGHSAEAAVPPAYLTSASLFARDQRGVVALMFGLMVLPLFAAVGLAIDFGNVMVVRTKAQMAADAAVLQASGIARDILKAGDGSDAATAAALADAKTRATALFNASAAQSSIKSYTFDIQMTRTGQKLSSTASFTVSNDNVIGRIFGSSSFSARGSAVSTSSLPNYSDVYLALDISGSMGIAASRAEMVKLFNAQGQRDTGAFQATNCVFGCHVVETHHGWKESFSTVAKRQGVRLRIDVLRDAVQEMISTAAADADSAPIYRLGLFTMGSSPDASTWSLNQLAPLSNNFAQLRAAASTITMVTPHTQNSYINEQLAAAAGYLPTSYDGSSQARSKKYVFIITDGARDVPPSFGNCIRPGGSDRCVNGIDPNRCKAYKDKGITVGVLYTTYIPVTTDPSNANSPLEYWYNLEMVQTGVYPKIAPALRDCASPGWFFEASDATGIKKAMDDMFAQTTQPPTLTN